MASFRSPSIRYTIGSTASILKPSQRRWAQVHDVRFLVTHQHSDRITEKYKSKLQRKAEKEGLKDIDELKAVYQKKIQAQKKGALATDPTPAASLSPFPEAPPPPPPTLTEAQQPSSAQTSHFPLKSLRSTNLPAIKPLSSYLDIAKTLSLPPKEIEYIWRLRHASNPQSLCATIAQSTYSRIEATARHHPQFILPLPREGQGAEIHFLQWAFPTPDTSTVLFTHLAEFKSRGEFAQPHTAVTHHLDLVGEKGLVLLQGSVVEGRGVTVDESKWLLMCLQKFYTGEGGEERRKRLLQQFSNGDGGFKVEELLEEAEKIL